MELPAAHSEREWILIGMAECCAAHGFEATTVADVCAAAGVSRTAFEREFAGTQECLGAAMESIVGQGWTALDEVVAPDRPWAATLRDGVATLLALLAARPAFAHVALLEAAPAGGRAGALHSSARGALLDFLERGRALAKPGIPRSAARGALAGAEALVVGRIAAGEATHLAELVPDVTYMLAVPFLGIGEAQRLAEGAARRGRLRAVA